jgi:integrase
MSYSSKALKRPSIKMENGATVNQIRGIGTDGDFILRQRVNDYIIRSYVNTLFDKLMIEILEAGAGGGFSSKEVKMSLYKRERSRYFYVDIAYNELRLRKSTKCENRRDAEKVKLHLLLKMMNVPSASNTFPSVPQESQDTLPPSFEQASMIYLEEKCKSKKSYRREMLCHRDLISYFGSQRIDMITPQKVHAWLQGEKKRIVRGGKIISARSINYNRGYLHRMFEFAVNVYGWIKDNPVKNIQPLAENNMRDRVLSPEEEIALFPFLRQEWLRVVVNFALETGLRLGEIAALKKSQFLMDVEIPHFKIRREKSGVMTEFPVVSETLSLIVEKHLGDNFHTDNFFCDDNGKPLNTSSISHNFKTAAKRAGLHDLTFHDLRRTFFTRLRWANCNPTLAEYLMGHKLPHLTARYLSFSLSDIAEEMKKLNKPKDVYVTHTSHSGEKAKVAEMS